MSLSILARAFCAAAALFAVGSAAAQPAPWAESISVVVSEHSGAALSEHQVPFSIDTQQLIAQGRLRADAADLRFAMDEAGSQPVLHWIEGGVGTTDTRVWLRVPSIPAGADVGVYMFIGNAAAADTSTLDVFDFADDVANSATQQTSNTNAGGVGHSQRGFRFTVDEELLLVALGKNTPSANPRTVTLFDGTTQAVLEQHVVTGPATTWSYQPLPQPRWLATGSEYLLQIYTPADDPAYYFLAAPVMSPRVNYLDMRYCNDCDANAFPTSVLNNMLYGYVDFQFRTRKQASPQPTATLGISISTTTLSADANPADFGNSVTLTATVSGALTAEGSVAFSMGGVLQCDVAVVANSASCVLGSLPVGSYALEAVYSGSGVVSGSSDTLALEVQAVAPGTPTGVSAVAGNGQATISFVAPAFDGGAPMTFHAQCTDGVVVVLGSAAASPIVVGGLDNGTTYQCSVHASNAGGDGAASAPVAVTPMSLPGAPTGLVATAGDGEAQLTFAAPIDDGGSAIVGYEASCTDGSVTITAASVASPIVLMGLANGTIYACTVTASNSLGAGPASAPVDVMPQGLPGAPTAVVATGEDASVRIAFSTPASDGGAAITAYTAQCSDGASTFSASGPAAPLLVGGLVNGTAYSCTVTASNIHGQGPASAAVNAVPLAVPGAPTAVSAVPHDGRVAMHFAAPASDGGSPVTGYVARCSDGSTTYEASGNASPLFVEGLVNGVSYACTVSAINALGEGTASAVQNATPLGAVANPQPAIIPALDRSGLALLMLALFGAAFVARRRM